MDWMMCPAPPLPSPSSPSFSEPRPYTKISRKKMPLCGGGGQKGNFHKKKSLKPYPLPSSNSSIALLSVFRRIESRTCSHEKKEEEERHLSFFLV